MDDKNKPTRTLSRYVIFKDYMGRYMWYRFEPKYGFVDCSGLWEYVLNRPARGRWKSW